MQEEKSSSDPLWKEKGSGQDTFTRFAKYDTQTTKPEDPKHTVKTRCESATVHEQQKGHINCHLT